MTKSERLMQLISLLKEERKTSIDDISNKLNVSKRTAYRYLNSLYQMDIPLVYDDGFHVDVTREFPFAKLNEDEIELICFCLQNNNLIKYPFFYNKFMVIQNKILEKKSVVSNEDKNKIIEYEKLLLNKPASLNKDIISIFTKAIVDNKTISLTISGRSVTLKKLIPIRILLTDKEPKIIVKKDSSKKNTSYEIGLIEDVQIEI